MNNYDTSSSGVNLELSVFLDNDLSRHYFDESFHVLQYSSMRQHSILVFNWFGNTDQSGFCFSDIENYTYTKTDLLNAIFVWDDDKQATRDSFISYAGYSIHKANKQDLVEYIEYRLYQHSDIADFYQEYLTPNYQTLISRGHCQGDYSEIIFTKSLLNDIRDQLVACKNMTDQQIAEYFQDDIDHLLWDSPLYARLTIDDEEFYLDEFQNDRYSYDKQEIIDHVKNTLKHEKLEYIVGWLTDNLPDQPDYI